jgi:hypothetical protein
MLRYDITGQRFGKLLAVEQLPRRKGAWHSTWRCACSCGKDCKRTSYELRRGLSVNCGCSKRRLKSHGVSGNSSYRVWVNMLARCYNPNDVGWPYYGGRGITVCDRWRESVLNFVADMGARPLGRTLDRIDSAGSYCKENCRWADLEAQANNRRNSRRLDLDGESMTLAQWARRAGISQSLLTWRLSAGWSARDALFKAPRKYGVGG